MQMASKDSHFYKNQEKSESILVNIVESQFLSGFLH